MVVAVVVPPGAAGLAPEDGGVRTMAGLAGGVRAAWAGASAVPPMAAAVTGLDAPWRATSWETAAAISCTVASDLPIAVIMVADWVLRSWMAAVVPA